MDFSIKFVLNCICKNRRVLKFSNSIEMMILDNHNVAVDVS